MRLGLVVIAVKSAMAGQPATKLAPYRDVTEARGNCCLSLGEPSKWTMMLGNTYRIRMTGAVERLRFYFGQACGDETSARVAIWRANPAGGYDLVAESENLIRKLKVGLINDVALSTPLPVQIGDYYGTVETGAAFAQACGPWALQPDPASKMAFQARMPTRTLFTWSGAVSGSAIRIELYTRSRAKLVTVGDSLIAGHPVTHSYCDPGPGNAPLSTIGAKVAGAMGWTWIDCGIGGQTTDQIAARYGKDVLSLAPEAVLMNGGINDLNNTANAPDRILANWRTMLEANSAAGTRSIVLLLLPGAFMSNDKMAIRDEVNRKLQELAETVHALAIDPGPYIGVSRPGGPEHNLWDLKPEFDCGDHLHLNAAGYRRLAEAIVDALQGKRPADLEASPPPAQPGPLR